MPMFAANAAKIAPPLSWPSPPAMDLASTRSGRDPHLSRDLTVALPERHLRGERGILGRGLDVAGGVDGPRADGVIARRRRAPVVGPEGPREEPGTWEGPSGSLQAPLPTRSRCHARPSARSALRGRH